MPLYFCIREELVSTLYRCIPPVHSFLERAVKDERLARYPRTILKNAVTSFLEEIRKNIQDGMYMDETALYNALSDVHFFRNMYERVLPHFRRIINATGVVLHTNAGRAILSEEAAQAVYTACRHYSNLELDLTTGERGTRYSHIEALLCTITGAEAALIVNNNAAAVLLILDTLCHGKEVITSRGQLVEIGGSFRIPDVMKKSGATLVEVGTTNRTHYNDYEQAITENTAALLRVHTSNFKIIGFTKTIELEELVALGKQYGIPVIEDLGSGSLFPLHTHGLSKEPTVQEVVGAGVDIVSFSGDKVLGGPQAGIIVGKKHYIEQLKKNQLTRALRVDKMALSALEATLRLYLEPEKLTEKNPTIAMLTTPFTVLVQRAKQLELLLTQLHSNDFTVTLRESASKVGGGSFPEDLIKTMCVALSCLTVPVHTMRLALLRVPLPLLVRVEDNLLMLDVRTITEEELPLIVTSIQEAFTYAKQVE